MPTITASDAPILVIGATGNVGAAVVAALVARGLPVRAAARNVEDVTRRFGATVAPVALDFADPAGFAAAVRGARGLFLLRPPAISDVRGTLNVLIDQAVAASVPQVVFLSVAGADRQRYLPHHKVEVHLQAQPRLAVTLLRPGFFAQNLGDAYRQDIVEDDRLYVPAGQGHVAFVDCRDLAEVAARAFEEPGRAAGRAFLLTGGAVVSFGEVAASLSAVLSRPIAYVPASLVGYVRHLRRRRLPWPQAVVQALLHLGLRLGNGAVVDPTLGELLGRPPRTVQDYIRDHAGLWTKGGARRP